MKSQPNPVFLFLGEIIAGAFTGLVLGYVGGRIAAVSIVNANSGFNDLVAIITALFIAYPLGVTLGNYFFNRCFRGQASFWLALLGSVVGAIWVFLMAYPLGVVVWASLPPVFAAVATGGLPFNLKVKMRSL